jgi:hypothetical protein
VTQPDVNKITEFPIKMPILADRMPGARMDVTVEFVFASAEIKMVVLLAGIKTEHVVSLE